MSFSVQLLVRTAAGRCGRLKLASADSAIATGTILKLSEPLGRRSVVAFRHKKAGRTASGLRESRASRT
jgi:hypothetical protein